MGRQAGDTQKKDMEAFENVLEAVTKNGVRRFVLISIVACNDAVDVLFSLASAIADVSCLGSLFLFRSPTSTISTAWRSGWRRPRCPMSQ